MTDKLTSDRVVPTAPRRWKSVRLNLYVYAALALVVFVMAVPVARANGFWSVSGKVTGTGEKVSVTGLDPAEIKGWMTIKDVLASYKVSQQEFYAKFSIPADHPTDQALSTIEKIAPEFSRGEAARLAGRTAQVALSGARQNDGPRRTECPLGPVPFDADTRTRGRAAAAPRR